MRRTLVLAAAVTLLASLVFATGSADDEGGAINPAGRATAWVSGPAGTERDIVLQYGPYTIGPGQDLSRVDLEVVGTNGFVIAARPALRYPTGVEPLNTDVHIHHAHWVWFDQDAPGYNRWFFGTGEEKTQGSIAWRADVENAARGTNLAYGIPMKQGDTLLLVSMVHNKTSSPVVVWIEAKFTFVDGTAEEIAGATGTKWAGRDFHSLVPTLHGWTFDVPRNPFAPDPDGVYVYPKDFGGQAPPPGVLPTEGRWRGLGHIFTAPWDGTIIVGAGHLHGGGGQVVVENLGQPDDRCANDGLGLAGGTTLFKSDAFYRDFNGTVVTPSEDLQMGITKPGWRAKVRAGDRLVINGTYDTTDYGYWDAMSYFGFYTDTTTGVGRTALESCAPTLFETDPYQGVAFESVTNRPWDAYPALEVCGVGAPSRPCDIPRTFERGEPTDTVTITGFVYTPGGQGLRGTPLGRSPVIRQGESLTFVNADLAADIRHTITSCPAPCSGQYVANYPNSDGLFDSEILGPDPLVSTYNKDGIYKWSTPTSLPAGTYTYYCRIHPFMRGSFIVEPREG